jgi:hypothetical protein
MKTITKLWILLTILVILSPLGLFLPEHFKAGAAWGEWGPEEIKELVGFIPKGLEKLASIWTAPMPDYAFKGWEEKGLRHLSLAYIISAVAGIAAVIALVYLMGKLISKKD